MSDFLQRISSLSPDRLRLLAGELKSRLDRSEGLLAARHEPIAVVGIGCRFAGGADSPDNYWRLLRDGVDAVTEVPAERWDVPGLFADDPDAAGKMTTRWGSFVSGLEEFDPWFFGISPREAVGMDPQQRLLLEVAWEALEHAGISPDRLEGTPTGVFLGLCNHDFHALRLERPYDEIDSYFASGVAGSMAAGRISYLLGLQGPAFTVDTACSSSLVALHLACESLRSGESRTALAAGVSLILTPETMIGLSKSRILATDGRCRTFDAAAGGIARGEGCAVVVLKRLSDARADGDRVLAVIRASAINQDGRSNGITAPNGPAQEALLRTTLEKSGLRPGDIDYVEAHGTGTTLGDPIEVRALASVYGERPGDRPLQIGSMKTNLGHLEAAAGIAGFIKVVLALQAKEIPPHLHLRTRNPHIEWDRLPIDIPTSLAPWSPASAELPRRGAVSAFGFSGTNAHVIVEEAPTNPVRTAGPDRSAHVLPLSARTMPLLRTLAQRYVDALERADDTALADICHTAATGRGLFPLRLAAVGLSPKQTAEALRAWLDQGEAPGVHAGKAAPASASDPVFVFTGQGSQTAGMGRELFDTEPVFRAALERCDAILRNELTVPLLSVLYPPPGASDSGESLIDRTEFAQPALFALEYALAELWRSWGVEPVAVIGHSLGEYVAATVAGLFTLEDGLRLVARRGRLMQSLPSGGAMAAVFTTLERAEAAVAPYSDSLAIAAVNGPENIVLSGDERVLARALDELQAEGINSRRLVVSGAFHSPLMDPILDQFEQMVAEVSFGEPHIAIVSNLTGSLNEPGELQRPAYWREHLRRPVRFLAGIRALEAAGHRTFLEIGPHPTLTGLVSAALEGGDAALVHSLRRGQSDWAEVAAAAGALHVRGLRLDWEAFDRPWPRQTVSLPTTPFDRRRFWAGWSAKAHGVAQYPSEAGWTWELGWEDSPIASAGADLDRISKALTARAPELVVEHGAEDYEQGLPLLDRLTTTLILRALRSLGYTPRSGDRFSADELQQRLGILTAHDRLFRRMLAILREDGALAADGEEWVVAAEIPEGDPRALADELVGAAPAMRAEVELTVRCGLALAEVLRGRADPLELLFPGGSTDEAAALYSEAPSFRVFNTLVRDAVSQIAAGRPSSRLRILEVGGGTGGVTKELLPVLPWEDTRYVFTDVSPLFIGRARERFGKYTGFEGAVLDVTRDPHAQGFAEERFDVIVASNVLHATPDLRQTLSNLHSVLAPGGVIVVLEGVLPQRFGDLTVGLTDGWWSFTDSELRPDYALMDPERWRQTFESCGFEAATDLPRTTASAGVLAQQRVLLARRPRERPASASRWIALTGGGEASAAVVEALEIAGVTTAAIATTGTSEALSALDRELARGGVEGVLHLVSLDGDDTAPLDGLALVDAERSACESALEAVRALVRNPGPRLVLVTRNAEAAAPGDVVDPSGSPLWGLGRGIALEHPELRCVTVDLPSGAVSGEALSAVLATEQPEDQVALRDVGARVPRIRPATLSPSAEVPRFDPAGAYLITGGLAGLGLRVARWMAQNGAGQLILAARSEPSAATRQEIGQLEEAGTKVRVVLGDVADLAAVREMVAAAGAAPLRGVMHAAGMTDDSALAKLDWDRTERVMRAKIAGSWNLHLATAGMALDHFVLFSSGAAFLGSPGQTNHAMANNYLGALAHQRRAEGLAALAVDWGPWAEVGAATRDGVLERARAAGLGAIQPEQGLEMLGRLMTEGKVRVAAVPVDWGTYLSQVSAGAGRALFNGVRPAPRASAESAVSELPGGVETPVAVAAVPYLSVELSGAVAGRRSEVALDGVRVIAGRVLGAGAGTDIDPMTPLTELGLDSLMAVEMRNRLATALGQPLPATLLFNYPSLESLAGYVVERVHPRAEESHSAVSIPSLQASEGTDLDELSEDEVADLLAAKLKDV